MRNLVAIRTRYSFTPMYDQPPIDLTCFPKEGPASRPQPVILSFHRRILDAIYYGSVGESPVQTREHDVDLTISGALDYSTFHDSDTLLLEFISFYLRELDVYDRGLHSSVTRFVADMIRGRKRPVSVSNVAITLALEINVVKEYIYEVVDEDTILQSVLSESARQVQHGMVPASKAAILKALKPERVVKRRGDSGAKVDNEDQCGKKRKRDDQEEEEEAESCPICLDEFMIRERVMKMTCDHRFHRRCIVKWLKTSHYCPVCRFEISTK